MAKNMFSLLDNINEDNEIIKNSEDEETSEEQSFFDIGLELEEKNKIDEAIKAYKKAIIKDRSVEAMHNLGCIYEQRNNKEEAIKFYEMGALSKDTDSMHNIAAIYYNKKDYINAYYYYKQTVQHKIYKNLYWMSVCLYNLIEKKHYAETEEQKMLTKAQNIFKLYLDSKKLDKQDRFFFYKIFIEKNDKLFELD